MSLSGYQVQRLRQIAQQAQPNATSTVFLPVAPNECACWRWATSGLQAGIAHDPAQVFNYIATGIDIDQGSGWRAQRYTAALQGARARYTQYETGDYAAIGGVTYDTWFDQILSGVVREFCRGLGLVPGTGPFQQNNGARYFVCVKYDRTSGAGERYAPNYTHWWLRTDLGGGRFVCLEMFPQSNALTFRWNHAHAVNNVHMQEVTNLAPNHMAVLNHVIPNPVPVPAGQQ
jgi:hypothetical protein